MVNDDDIAADTVDPVMDEQLAMFVVESHRRSHPSAAQTSSASQGTGDEDVEEDNTAIINDKVWCGVMDDAPRRLRGTDRLRCAAKMAFACDVIGRVT